MSRSRCAPITLSMCQKLDSRSAEAFFDHFRRSPAISMLATNSTNHKIGNLGHRQSNDRELLINYLAAVG